MRKTLLLVSIFVIAAFKVFAAQNTNNNYIQNKSKPIKTVIQESAVASECVNVKSGIIFMPILITFEDNLDYKSKSLEEKIESGLGKEAIDKVKEIPSLFFNGSESVSDLKFIKPQEKFIKWQNNNPKWFDSFYNLSVTESAQLPEKYIQNNTTKYVLFSKLKHLGVLDSRNPIVNTNLFSLIVSVNVQILFVVVSIPDGVIVKKFVATGHSGMAKLQLKADHSKPYDINSLMNQGFASFLVDFKNTMTDSKFGNCIIESNIAKDDWQPY